MKTSASTRVTFVVVSGQSPCWQRDVAKRTRIAMWQNPGHPLSHFRYGSHIIKRFQIFELKTDLVLNSFLERTWPRGGEIFSCICVRVPVCVCSYCTYVDVSACVFVLCWRLCQIGDRRLQKVLSQNSYIKYVVQLRCTAQGRARIDVHNKAWTNMATERFTAKENDEKRRG